MTENEKQRRKSAPMSLIDVPMKALKLASPISLVVMAHGMAAASFVLLFLLQAFSLSIPYISLLIGSPTEYSPAASLWIAVAIGTFATYEIVFLPFLPAEFQAKLKTVYVIYHLPWCVVITYVALLPSSSPLVWLSAAVMYSFTIAGIVAPSS